MPGFFAQNPCQPLTYLHEDITLTFKPYEPRIIDKENTSNLFNPSEWNNVWGDLFQPVRGLFNIAKGIKDIVYFLIIVGLFPFSFPIIIFYKLKMNTRLSFGDAFINIGKDILYYFIHGPLIILRGALQIATTPLTWFFRIPIRLLLTWGSKNSETDQNSFGNLPKPPFDSPSNTNPNFVPVYGYPQSPVYNVYNTVSVGDSDPNCYNSYVFVPVGDSDPNYYNSYVSVPVGDSDPNYYNPYVSVYGSQNSQPPEQSHTDLRSIYLQTQSPSY